MPTQPKGNVRPTRPLEGNHNKKHHITISENAMYEFTEALKASNIQLGPNDEVMITKDMAVTGPYNYRQVNLRHQILMEVAKVYKTPIKNDFEVSDSSHFINFLDDVYNYILDGERKTDTPKPTTEPTPQLDKKSGWN